MQLKEDALAIPPNVSQNVFRVISLGLATYHECATVYDHEDLLDLLEIHEASSYNKKIIEEVQNVR